MIVRLHYVILVAFLLCGWGVPSAFPAEPASLTAAAAIEPAMPRAPGERHALPYFPPDPDSGPGRPGDHKPVGGSDKDGEEKIHVMEETVVESTTVVDGTVEDPFEDPFETGSQQVSDPLEPLNVKTFTFNYNLDRYVLKPTARVYSGILPPDVQHSLANAFDNLGFASRFLNSIFQGKFGRAGIEMQRFLLNSTLGVGGLFDVAKHMFGLEGPPPEDAGQTLASYGVPAGPYLVLPLFPPMTVRDAVGRAGDIFMNPVNYFIPFWPNLGLNGGGRVNDRAINLGVFEELEASTIDLYGAARSGYMDRRAKEIEE